MGEEKEEIEKVSKKGKERGKKQKSNNKKNNNYTKSNIKNKKTNNIIDKEIKDKDKVKKEKGKNKDKKSKSGSKTKNEDKKTEKNVINKEDIIESDNIDELENTKSNKEKRVVLDSVGKVKVDEIETEEQLDKLQEKTNEKLKENNKEDVKIITKKELEKKELEKKELEENIQKKVIEKLGNNRKKRISIIIFLVLISLIAIISTCFSVIYMGKDVIVPNVYIGDINVGNMSKEKAKEKIETIYTEKASKEIKASLKDYEHIIKPEMVEFKVDINSAVDKAYMIGRNRKYSRK